MEENEMKICKFCGKGFIPNPSRPHHKFCTKYCQCAHWGRTHKEYHKIQNKKYTERKRKEKNKKCIICGKSLPPNKSKFCEKKCARKFLNLENRKKRNEIQKKFNLYKEKIGCQNIECGYNRCGAALEYHHLDKNNKNKKFRMMATSWYKMYNKFKEEESKCVLLCSTCHKEIEYGMSLKIIKESGV